jgi:N-methylhydantoinase A/oxoprolinase/acetone carboxylase beta subunit
VGYRLVTEGLVFGGNTLTATDIAVASGAANIGNAKHLAKLDNAVIETAVATMHSIIDKGIDQMKSSREPVPVILVGGGAVLVSQVLETAAEIYRPEHSGVANAIGAANAQVGSETERIVSYRRVPRDKLIEEMTGQLRQELQHAGADADTIRIADIEETAVSYMADESTRIRVKMVGDLLFAKSGSARCP